MSNNESNTYRTDLMNRLRSKIEKFDYKSNYPYDGYTINIGCINLTPCEYNDLLRITPKGSKIEVNIV